MTSQRADTRRPYDFSRRKPLSPIAKRCIDGDISFDKAVQDFMLQILRWCAVNCGGSQIKMARQLGIQHSTIKMILSHHGMIPSRLKPPANAKVRLGKREAQEVLAAHILGILDVVYGVQFPANEQHEFDSAPAQEPRV